MEGLRNAPSSKFKIRFNSVLNACGKRGSKLGNALGVLALMYSFSEGFADWIELDRIIGGDNYDVAVPIIAGIATGAIYKSTQGPKTMALAAVLGVPRCLHRPSRPICFPAHSSCITELCIYTYLIYFTHHHKKSYQHFNPYAAYEYIETKVRYGVKGAASASERSNVSRFAFPALHPSQIVLRVPWWTARSPGHTHVRAPQLEYEKHFDGPLSEAFHSAKSLLQFTIRKVIESHAAQLCTIIKVLCQRPNLFALLRERPA